MSFLFLPCFKQIFKFGIQLLFSSLFPFGAKTRVFLLKVVFLFSRCFFVYFLRVPPLQPPLTVRLAFPITATASPLSGRAGGARAAAALPGLCNGGFLPATPRHALHKRLA